MSGKRESLNEPYHSPKFSELGEFHEDGSWDELLPRDEMLTVMGEYLITKYPFLAPINEYEKQWNNGQYIAKNIDDARTYKQSLTEEEQQIADAFIHMCWHITYWEPILGGFRKWAMDMRGLHNLLHQKPQGTTSTPAVEHAEKT
jgi:hypothetical protein